MCLPGETERCALDAADPNSFSATHLNIPESSGKASVITRVQTSSEITDSDMLLNHKRQMLICRNCSLQDCYSVMGIGINKVQKSDVQGLRKSRGLEGARMKENCFFL